MILRELYKSLTPYQKPFYGLDTIHRLETIPLEDSEWRFLLLIEILVVGKALWFVYFRDYKGEFSIKEIWTLFAAAKSFASNMSICSWKLRLIVEWLFNEFQDLDIDYWLVSWVLNNTLNIKRLLNWEKITIEDKKLDLVNKQNISQWYIFKWKSWTIYSWTWITQIRKHNEHDLLDIIEWYIWGNETLKKIIPYLVNNREELKTEFKQYRFALISALALVFWLESKVSDYILAKLEDKVTDETIIDSSKAPF